MKRFFSNIRRPGSMIPGLCLLFLLFTVKNTVAQETETLTGLENPKQVRYMASMSMGLIPGGYDVVTFIPLTMQISQGILYNKAIYTGISLAVETFEPNLLTLTFEPRFYLGNGWIHPWVGARAGYGFTAEKNATIGWSSTEYTGGFAFGTGGGFSYDISDKVSTWFSIGYRYQEVHGTTNPGEVYEQYNQIKYNRFELKIGVALH